MVGLVSLLLRIKTMIRKLMEGDARGRWFFGASSDFPGRRPMCQPVTLDYSRPRGMRKENFFVQKRCTAH